MRGFGIEAVPTVGAPFDPEVHEAIMREPSEEVSIHWFFNRSIPAV